GGLIVSSLCFDWERKSFINPFCRQKSKVRSSGVQFSIKSIDLISMAGYSTTPLVKKLGLSEGARVRFIHAPEEYESWLTPMPAVRRTRKPPYDFVHLFVNTVEELEDLLPELRNAIDD